MILQGEAWRRRAYWRDSSGQNHVQGQHERAGGAATAAGNHIYEGAESSQRVAAEGCTRGV